jgi:hypothetical protein
MFANRSEQAPQPRHIFDGQTRISAQIGRESEHNANGGQLTTALTVDQLV